MVSRHTRFVGLLDCQGVCAEKMRWRRRGCTRLSPSLGVSLEPQFLACGFSSMHELLYGTDTCFAWLYNDIDLLY